MNLINHCYLIKTVVKDVSRTRQGPGGVKRDVRSQETPQLIPTLSRNRTLNFFSPNLSLSFLKARYTELDGDDDDRYLIRGLVQLEN